MGKRVLEIGCGPGYLGKQLAYFASEFVGIDQSPLAVTIARSVSQPNCQYYCVGDLGGIMHHRRSIDTMVSRFFFIHQNYVNARWVLRLAAELLRNGGRVEADFFNGPTGLPAATSSRDKDPTSGYNFTVDEISAVARDAGLEVSSVVPRPELRRTFVTMTSP